MRVKELTAGEGNHVVLGAVGLKAAMETAFSVVRGGGVVSRVGAPQFSEVPFGGRGLPAQRDPDRRGRPGPRVHPDTIAIGPGRDDRARSRLDRTVDLDDVPDGYRAMADREPSRFSCGPERAKETSMGYRRIGRTGVSVNPLALGTKLFTPLAEGIRRPVEVCGAAQRRLRHDRSGQPA